MAANKFAFIIVADMTAVSVAERIFVRTVDYAVGAHNAVEAKRVFTVA